MEIHIWIMTDCINNIYQEWNILNSIYTKALSIIQ
jgi:hypothetical protein